MALWPLTSEILITFVLSAVLLYRYGNWVTHNVITTLSVFVAWFFSFIVIFIIPLDVSTVSNNSFIITDLNLFGIRLRITNANSTGIQLTHIHKIILVRFIQQLNFTNLRTLQMGLAQMKQLQPYHRSLPARFLESLMERVLVFNRGVTFLGMFFQPYGE